MPPRCLSEIVRVTTLVGNSSFVDTDGLDHGSPLASGGMLSNGGAGDINGWASAFQSDVLSEVPFTCFSIPTQHLLLV